MARPAPVCAGCGWPGGVTASNGGLNCCFCVCSSLIYLFALLSFLLLVFCIVLQKGALVKAYDLNGSHSRFPSGGGDVLPAHFKLVLCRIFFPIFWLLAIFHCRCGLRSFLFFFRSHRSQISGSARRGATPGCALFRGGTTP